MEEQEKKEKKNSEEGENPLGKEQELQRKRSKLEALVWLVEWLWKTHKQQGGDTRGLV